MYCNVGDYKKEKQFITYQATSAYVWICTLHSTNIMAIFLNYKEFGS
jgi:hypothetical protein